MDELIKIRSKLIFALLASLTLGLAPFMQESHLVGKIRWVLGGADGMKLMDYLDLVMHGAPWVILMYYTYKYILI